MLFKMSILGTLLMVYGGINHLRKNEASRNLLLSKIPKAKQEFVMDLLAPKPSTQTVAVQKKSGPNVLEQAQADLKKLRSYDESCMDIDADPEKCRMAERPREPSANKYQADENSKLGKAQKEIKRLERAKFEEFDKIDSL